MYAPWLLLNMWIDSSITRALKWYGTVAELNPVQCMSKIYWLLLLFQDLNIYVHLQYDSNNIPISIFHLCSQIVIIDATQKNYVCTMLCSAEWAYLCCIWLWPYVLEAQMVKAMFWINGGTGLNPAQCCEPISTKLVIKFWSRGQIYFMLKAYIDNSC